MKRMTKKDFPKLKLVEIEWYDAATGSTSGWTSQSDAKAYSNPEVVRTVGYILKQDKVSITVVQSMAAKRERGQILNPMSIPTDWVQRTKVLKGLK